MIYKLTDQITFGKHNGLTIQEIINEDVTYIEWCIDTIDRFELDDKAMEVYKKDIDKHYADDDYLDNSWRDGHPYDYED